MNLSQVQQLHLEPSTFCNAKCPHCPRFDQTMPDVIESTGKLHPDLKQQHMNIDVITKNLEIDKMTSLRNVMLQGDKGDPCMNPNIGSLIDLFATHQNKPIVNLVTNGSIRNKKWWKDLGNKDYKNLKVTFSIDGLQDTNHLYRVGLEWKDIINNVCSFIDNGGQAEWKFIVFKHNQHQIDQARALSKQLGFKNFVVTFPDLPRFKDRVTWTVKTSGDSSHEISPSDITPNDLPRQTRSFTVMPYRLESIPEHICPYLRNGYLYVTASHKIIPCCMMHFDIDLNYFGREQLLNLVGSFDNIDLSLNSLGTILNNDFFSKTLDQSFLTDNWHNTCDKSCRANIEKNIKILNL